MTDDMMTRIRRASDEALLNRGVPPFDTTADADGEPVTVETALFGDFEVDPEAAETFRRAEANVEDQLLDPDDFRTTDHNVGLRMERVRILALRAHGYWDGDRPLPSNVVGMDD